MMSFTKTQYNWYKIGDLEYSANFRFFLEHQVFSVRRGNIISFYSRLEKKEFMTVNIQEISNRMEPYEEKTIMQQIHTKLLNGEYGDGEFIR